MSTPPEPASVLPEIRDTQALGLSSGQPFLTFITPTYRRPRRLASCLESVSSQSGVSGVEHLVLPDHVGVGIDGMYARLPRYAEAVHGEYVHVLADDDVLADCGAVEALREVARAKGMPPVLIVDVVKHMEPGPLRLPLDGARVAELGPIEGRIDLGCLVVRADVWKAHVHQYGRRYAGDFDFAAALWSAGHPFTYAGVMFLFGAVMRGRPE